MTIWKKQTVHCSACEGALHRFLIRPKDGKKIENFFCDRICKGKWQAENLRPISREELSRLYINEKKSANEIARLVGRNSKRVWEWLIFYGVATRSRGHDVAQHFKKGHKIGVGRIISEKQKEVLREARKRDGSKGLFKNGVHVLKGRKGAAHPRFKGGMTPERQAFYSSDEWKEACKIVWHRADAKCERCTLDHRTIDRSQVSFHVHHVISFQIRATRAIPSNLLLLCQDCHRFVHSKLNTAKQFIGEAA